MFGDDDGQRLQGLAQMGSHGRLGVVQTPLFDGVEYGFVLTGEIQHR
jgi:hypothetical protein